MHKFCIAAALLVVAVPLAATAQPVLSNEDCAVLDELVRKHVWFAATESRGERPVRALGAMVGATRRHVCRRTVEVTTRAFTEALASLNLSIGWEPPNPGDYCLSGDFDQCYPSGRPGGRHLPAGRLAFVYDAWQGVRDAVRSHMLPGGADVSVFSAASLDDALAARIGERVEGPLHARYAPR